MTGMLCILCPLPLQSVTPSLLKEGESIYMQW